MDKLVELREKLLKLVTRQDEILSLAETEERDITEDEETEFNDLDKQIDEAEEEIRTEEARLARQKKLDERKEALKKAQRSVPIYTGKQADADASEFRNIGEFLHSVRFNHSDPRLEEFRAQSMGTGSEGGFAVPTQFRETLLSVTPQQAIFRPRATVIEAGDPPDSEISMPALDQGTGENIHAGAVVEWIGEGATKPETDIKLREITLKPKEVAAYVVVTDKLLRNWGAAQSVIENQLRLAVISAEETAFLSGTGVGRPQGILNSPARIDIARTTASQVAWADIYGMYARLRMGMTPVWIASQTVIPYLVTIADAGSNSLWVPNAAPGLPPTLMGIPVLYHERSPALGSAGDLILADLSYYLIKNGSGPFVQASEHVYFTSNKTVIKIHWNVDGQSWLNDPIALEGATSNTVGPFIILN